MEPGRPELTEKPLTHAEIRTVIVGVLLAMLLAALDQTIVATAMPTIGRDLGDLEHLPWIVTAYLLASTAVTPLFGKLADIHGRRITLLASIATFMVGSVACALAPSMLALILARALQGLGGGALISLAQTIIGDIVAPRERARYQVYFASVFVTSSLAGPVLGGFFAESLHWSGIFWINLPLGAVAFAMTYVNLRRLPRHERRHALDVLGAGLMTAATVSLMLMLSWGGIRYPWLSAEIVGLGALSGLFWAAFGLRLRTAPEPLIPLEVLGNQVVRTGTLSASLAMGTFIGLSIFTPIYFEAAAGLSARQSGLALVPFMIGTVIGATIAGRSMARLTRYKRLPMAGLAGSIVAMSLLALTSGTVPLWAVEVLLMLTSIGLGTVLPVATVSIQSAVAPHQLGTATASMNFFRQLGGAVIVAGYGAIVLGGSAAAGRGLTLETLSLSGHGAAELGATFAYVFAAAAAGLAGSLLFLLRMRELPLRGRAAPASPAPD